MSTPDVSVPPEVAALLDARAAARAAKDWAASDRIRDEAAALGWLVRDTPDGQTAVPAPPYPVVQDVRALPDRSGEPDGRRASVGVVAAGWPDDVVTCVEALVAHTPDDVVVLVLDAGDVDGSGAVVHDLAVRHPGRIEELHVERVPGWSEAVTALVRADTAAVHVLLDPSTVLEGDALTPLLAALDDPGVVGAGWRGVGVDEGWTSFSDRPAGDVEALLGYLMAVRRSALLQVPPHPKARFYRNADMELSYALRDAGLGRLVAVPDLPVRQDRHRGYHDSDPAHRDKESRKTYDRFLQRFRGRDDLRLPTPP